MASKGKARAGDAPYWGDIPATIPMKPTGRRYSQDIEGGRRYSGQYGSAPQPSAQNRLSTQTTGTSDSLTIGASPTDSHFRQEGLAPRPASYGRNQDAYDSRRRRDSRDRDYYERGASGAPPAAPDIPRAPPVSYKQPYNQPAMPLSSQPVTRKSSTRRTDAPPAVADAENYQRERNGDKAREAVARAQGEYNRRRSSVDRSSDPRVAQLDDRAVLRKRSVRGGREARREEEPAVTPPKGTTISEAEAQRRREWAPDRSPLQRLELTLDSITKEEKRARVKEAEMLAREKAAQDERAGGGSVRFRNRPVAKGQEPGSRSDQELAPATNVTRSRSVREKDLPPPPPREEIAREARVVDKGRPVPVDTSRRTNGKATSTPVDGPPQRDRSFRERAVGTAAAAGVAGAVAGASLGRSDSKKLKKQPPVDTYTRQPVDASYRDDRGVIYTRDRNSNGNAQKEYTAAAPVATTQTRAPINGKTTTQTGPGDYDDYSSEDELDRPRKGSSSKKIAQMMGAGAVASHQRKASGQEEPAGTRGAGGPTQNHQSTHQPGPEQHHRHHLTDVLYGHHKDEFRPGAGLYEPHGMLDEWKKGGVALLTANMIDLEFPSDREKELGKAWWEQPHRRRSSTAARTGQGYDGYDSDGRQISDHSSSSDLPSDAEIAKRRWNQTLDIVLPRARQYIGFQGTSTNQAKVRRRNRSWRLEAPSTDVSSNTASRFSSNALLSSNASSLRALTRNYTLTSRLSFLFRRSKTSDVDTQLTRWVRSIRVPTPLAPTRFKPSLYLKCGPLLRYRGIRYDKASSSSTINATNDKEIWRGSVMIVTADSQSSYEMPPTLRLFVQPLELLPTPPAHVSGDGDLAPELVDPIVNLPKIGRDGSTMYLKPVELIPEEKDLSRDETENGMFDTQKILYDPKGDHSGVDEPKGTFTSRLKRTTMDGEKAGKYKEVKGFRLCAEQGCTFWRFNIEVELTSKQQRIAYRINRGPATGFWVPPRGESMNVMFHSCNGFSLSVNPDQFSGPDPLWRDVLSNHQSRPFHVMIGGGDQIYNDAVMRQTTLFRDWLTIKNPVHKDNAPFTQEMQDELDNFYLERYCMWFSQGLFGVANSQIPMINIFDDHDIIDGFGSYPHHTMSSPVFSGLGSVAFKYYMLFQHQSVINEGEETEPSWILGAHPGPYIPELSRSVFMRLGKKIAFLGLDCRTERQRDEIVTADTYNNVFDRLEKEIVKGETKHLIVLLGVPIAYPRLVWLENVLTSRLMDPVKALGKTGALGGFVNKLDGGVEILDDLDDHWTAKNHKAERNWFVRELQYIAEEKSVRVTILGGDVHLAAVGQFYSNPKLGIPKDRDFRYMPNIISSAIVNTPPPDMMADVLNKRNKVHHLDHDTDEDMIPLFTHDVTGAKRNNQRLLPRRNWCSIREYQPGSTPPPTPPSPYSEHSRSPSPEPQQQSGGLFRRLTGRSRGPAYAPDRSRPPLSGGSSGLFRSLSSRRTSTESERPGKPKRSLSLTRGNLFRRGPKHRDSGGINGYGEDSPTPPVTPPGEQYYTPRLRGGSGGSGDEGYYAPKPSPRGTMSKPVAPSQSYSQSQGQNQAQFHGQTHSRTHSDAQSVPFVPDSIGGAIHAAPQRPGGFHRTPTGLTARQLKKGGFEVNLRDGLDISLNCEVSQKDPTGITMPYRLLVPALWYDLQEAEEREQVMEMKRRGSVKRWVGL